MTDIKPCPFCGNRAKVSTREMKFLGINAFGEKLLRMAVQVICNRCHARGPVVTGVVIDPYTTGQAYMKEMAEKAVDKWNIDRDTNVINKRSGNRK